MSRVFSEKHGFSSLREGRPSRNRVGVEFDTAESHECMVKHFFSLGWLHGSRTQLPDGMPAHVRTDDGDHSIWFEATEGLRQGCVLSRLLLQRVLRC